jgi:hypothetical protein
MGQGSSTAWARRCFVLVAASLTACGPSSHNGARKAEVFQCVASAQRPDAYVDRICDARDPKECKRARSVIQLNPERACVGVQWSFPAQLKPERLTKGVIDRLRFGVPKNVFPTRSARWSHSGLLDTIDVSVIPLGDMRARIARTESAYQANTPEAPQAGYWIRGSEPDAWGGLTLVLSPSADLDHYLRCHGRTRGDTSELVGACEVTLQFNSVIELRYFVPAEELSHVRAYNEGLLAAADRLVVQHPNQHGQE